MLNAVFLALREPTELYIYYMLITDNGNANDKN